MGNGEWGIPHFFEKVVGCVAPSIVASSVRYLWRRTLRPRDDKRVFTPRIWYYYQEITTNIGLMTND
ncbi:hypothetical protein [Microcoleus sp. herbarium8]|uniref:hypothetical protein n=1 Tax=Microcoleus sp. herbarium8 TaxID=3055436 RepID=UPI002FD3B65E